MTKRKKYIEAEKELIQQIAFNIYQSRLKRNESGTAEEDWEEAIDIYERTFK